MYEDLIRELRNPYNTIAVDVAERQVYVHQVPLGKPGRERKADT